MKLFFQSEPERFGVQSEALRLNNQQSFALYSNGGYFASHQLLTLKLS